MKKIALVLLLSGAYSLNAVWYNPLPALKKIDYKTTAKTVLDGMRTKVTENWWRTGCIAGLASLTYAKRKPLKRKVNGMLVKVGLRSEKR